MVIPVHDEDSSEAGTRPWFVWIIVVINVCIFIYLTLLPTDVAQLLGFNFGLVPAFIADKAKYADFPFLIPPELTFVTYMFMHGSWIHLAANMLFLWIFGDNIEIAVGHWRFVLIFLLGGVAGGLAHFAVLPQSAVPLIGASAAVAAVVAGYLLLYPTARITLLILGIVTATVRAYWIFLLWLAWQVANVLVPLGTTDVAYLSHIGGFVAGVLLMLVFNREGVRLSGWFHR